MFNRWWANCLFFFMAMPVKVECRKKLDSSQQYIFCPNHFSYLDIPIMGMNPMNAIFVGKSDMENIPFFGYMYRKLHITVDRTKLKSKFSTFIQSLAALDKGKSLVIFPEGGIYSPNPPHIAPFKDGAFRAAIEKKISIVPVTIPYNWIILPDQPFVIHWRKNMMIFHEPIETKDLSTQDINGLKDRVYQVIDSELKK
ncbi:MAG: 1-acyl-sn-glycerol-3-phosphate acyltransferase [Flammeovirgaceae bacterium]|nr:1-acyl-sn-glycerol-3-phosphate acyltransferase [Flammeovirgaceae bacterium]